MVIRILTGKEVAGAVRYNERKVEEGQAERIHIANYPDPNIAEKYGKCRLQLLEQMTRLNPAVAKPSVHLAIAFHPSESITNDQLCRIGSEVMTEAGYGRQPYLMYRHDDTRHPHIHIVSVSIDPDGRKISDKYIRNRLNQIRKGIEQRHGLIKAERIVHQRDSIKAGDEADNPEEKHEQVISSIVEQAIDNFTFGTVDSFCQYLQMQDVLMKVTAGRSKTGVTFQAVEKTGMLTRPISASKLTSKPTNKRLATLFAVQAERHTKGCEATTAIIHQRLSRYERLTETEYKTTLQQVGIQVSDRGGVYLYVQARAGIVVQEKELGPALCRQSLLLRFSENTIRKPILEAEKVSRPQLNRTAGKAFISGSPADSNLVFTPSNQLLGKPPLKQVLPEISISAQATTVEKVVEPMPQSLEAGRGEAQETVLLVEKSKKEKKNRQKKGPRL